MKETRIKKITTTGILIALAIAAQSLRLILPATITPIAGVIIIGALVNLIIFIAAGRVGLISAVLVSVITPIIALLEGHLPNPLLIAPVALGNCILAIFWFILHTKMKYVSQFITVIVAALAKFLFLWWAVPWTFATFLYANWAKRAGAAEKILQTLTQNMSWPQLVTALIGGWLAIIILRVLPKGD